MLDRADLPTKGPVDTGKMSTVQAYAMWASSLDASAKGIAAGLRVFDADSLEDAVSEARDHWVRVCRFGPSHPSEFAAWSRVVIRNELTAYSRRATRRAQIEVELDAQPTYRSERLSTTESAELTVLGLAESEAKRTARELLAVMVREILDSLDQADRTVCQQIISSGCSFTEAARRLGIPRTSLYHRWYVCFTRPLMRALRERGRENQALADLFEAAYGIPLLEKTKRAERRVRHSRKGGRRLGS